MKENKKKIILIVIALILIVAGTIAAIVLLNKTNKTLTPKEKSLYEGLIYIENKSLIVERQKALEEEYIKEYKEKEYTLDNPYIKVNPYKIAPLSALIMFDTEKEVSGIITIKGKAAVDNLTFEFEKAKTHYVTIWGLFENSKNNIVIETADGKKKELEIDTNKNTDTGIINETSEKIENINNTQKINDFFIIDTPIMNKFSLIDSSGNTRVKFLNKISKYITTLDNSHILISDGSIEMDGKAYGIIEVDMAGKVYNYYKLDYGMGYGSERLDSGNILYMSNNGDEVNTFDKIVEINNKGETIRTINIYELMSEIDSNFMETKKDKWGYISGIDYDRDKNEIIVSLWYSSTVIGINYETGKINWILSNPANLSENFSSYLLTPTDATFEYPKGGYSIQKTNKGFSLMVTNWDLNDNLSCSSVVGKKSYVANYIVDTKQKTISEDSTFGKEENYFSYALGDYNHYKDYSIALFGRELINPNYNDETCMLNDFWDLNSKLVLLNKNNEIMYEATIPYASVIAEKYEVNKNIINKFVDGKTYNFKFSGNKEEEVKYEYYKDKIEQNKVNNFGLEFNADKLTINTDEELSLLLISKDNKIYKYNSETNGIFKYFLLNTHNEYFRIFVEKDGEVYNTGTYLYM